MFTHKKNYFNLNKSRTHTFQNGKGYLIRFSPILTSSASMALRKRSPETGKSNALILITSEKVILGDVVHPQIQNTINRHRGNVRNLHGRLFTSKCQEQQAEQALYGLEPHIRIIALEIENANSGSSPNMGRGSRCSNIDRASTYMISRVLLYRGRTRAKEAWFVSSLKDEIEMTKLQFR